MSRLIRIAFACAALTAGAASAAEDGYCHGEIVRSVSRFRGTIRSITPLTEGATELNPIDSDALFAVTIDIEGAAPQKFAIHSPSRTFGSGKLVGRSFDLVAARVDCDDKFQRYAELWVERRMRMVEPLKGYLEVGHAYRTKVTWEGDGMVIPSSFDLPMHHDAEIIVSNLQDFVETRPREVVLEVQSVRIRMTGERSWLSSYELKIVSAK